MIVEDLLRKFRRESEFFQDVLGQELAISVIPSLISNVLLKLDGSDFEEKFVEIFKTYTMLKPRTLRPLLRKNPPSEIKWRLLDVFFGSKSPLERLKSLMELEGAGFFFGTTLLSIAYEGAFIIYEDKLLKGIESLLLHLTEDWAGMKQVNTPERYMMFNELCKVIKKNYGFKSLAEVHEFFWHGYDSKWTFK